MNSRRLGEQIAPCSEMAKSTCALSACSGQDARPGPRGPVPPGHPAAGYSFARVGTPFFRAVKLNPTVVRAYPASSRPRSTRPGRLTLH